MISYNQSIDSSLLSDQKIFSPTEQKMAELWPKTYAHIWNNLYFEGHFGP